MIPGLLLLWGCVPEISRECQDMTNASSTYFGIAFGALIGGLISLWIYNRQKKTSKEQEITLDRIKMVEQKHEEILKRLQESSQHHARTLDSILDLNKRIDSIVEKQERIVESLARGGR